MIPTTMRTATQTQMRILVAGAGVAGVSFFVGATVVFMTAVVGVAVIVGVSALIDAVCSGVTVGVLLTAAFLVLFTDTANEENPGVTAV